MPRKSNPVPSYLYHRASGQARVIIRGKHFYLGPYGSDESRENYASLLADKVLNTVPALPPSPDEPEHSNGLLTVNDLVLAYLKYESRYYVSAGKATSEFSCIREAVLFSGEVTGLAVQLPGWRYPVVCDSATGKVQFDNYGGHWGKQVELDRFLQAYAFEIAQIEARRKGYAVTEQTLTDGSIKLTIQVVGGAA